MSPFDVVKASANPAILDYFSVASLSRKLQLLSLWSAHRWRDEGGKERSNNVKETLLLTLDSSACI